MVAAAAVAASAVVGVVGAVSSSNASKSAASTQAAAADRATAATQAEQGQIRADLLPYQTLGLGALNPLQVATGTNPGGNPLTAQLTKPFSPADLSKTPGYQFTLQQGEQAVNNGLSAQGLAQNNPLTGISGPAQKGAINYAEGLASTTYNQQLQNYLGQNQQIYNMLSGLVQGGQNAANQTGSYGTTNTANANNLLTSGAAATAGGQIGSTNALTGGLTGASNGVLNSIYLNKLTGGGLFNSGSTNPSSLPFDSANPFAEASYTGGTP